MARTFSVALLLLAVLCRPAAAAPTFSTPYDISADGADGRDPSLVVGPGGVLVCTWSRDDHRMAWSYSRDGGSSFSPPRSLRVAGGQSALTVTPSGVLLVARASPESLSCARSSDGGLSFLPPPGAVQRLTQAANPAISVDASGQVNLVWDVDSTLVDYARSTNDGQSFSIPQTISAPEGSSVRQWLPDVSTDSLRTTYVIWNRSRPFTSQKDRIYFSKATIGHSFISPVALTDTLRAARDGRMLANGAGLLDAMWVYDGATDTLFLVTSTNSGASFNRRAALGLPGDGGGVSRNLSMVRTPGGTLHVVLQTSVGGNLECFYTSIAPGSSTFATPVNISNSPGPSLTPAVVLSGVVPLVVWSDVIGSGRDIVFSKKQ